LRKYVAVQGIGKAPRKMIYLSRVGAGGLGGVAADLLESSSLGRPGRLGVRGDELFEVDVDAVRRRSRVA
jgi:hypothetical protein